MLSDLPGFLGKICRDVLYLESWLAALCILTLTTIMKVTEK
jgi:hypothetical protein